MTKGTSTSRRGLGHAASRVAYTHRHRQYAAARADSIFSSGHQREAAKAGYSPRRIADAASSVEQLFRRESAVSPHESSPVRSYGPKVLRGHDSSNVDKDRCRRSYGASHGPKRPQGKRRVRSYGSRHGYLKSERRVRSYGSRRLHSYGERHVYSYGYRRGRLHWYGRDGRHVVQHSHDSSVNRFRRLFRASSLIELFSSGAGALWVAGLFLNSFSHNLNFSNLPAILKVKYQLAGNEYKSLSQAQAVWKSIPVQIRAGGPEALGKFHQGKEWSHIIPKSWGRIIDRGQRGLVGLSRRTAPWEPIQ